MANENTTPIRAAETTTQVDSPSEGAGSPVNPQPMGEPKRENEQKTAPAQPDKNEPQK
jgi:hypothetical protein